MMQLTTKIKEKTMRDILFRGKRTDNHQWVEGFLIFEDIENPNPYIINRWKHRVAHKTVGQYTGLIDKNGSGIFEGDIVKITDFQIGCVVYECGAFGIAVMPRIDWDYLDSEIAEITGCNNSPYFCCNDNFISLWELMWNYNQEENNCYVVEVIGNIHDNPELLEGGEGNG
ncbi:MAG: YopX family protein [Ruminiclostridium sp.]